MMNYAVGHNMPGYLPDADVDVFTDWDEARMALVEDMRFVLDYGLEDVGEEAELAEAIADLETTGEGDWGRTVGNTAWWIALTDEEADES